jgi:hypothetical protein
MITTSETSFAQGGKPQTCCCSRKKGHISPECPDKNAIKKEDWHIRKAKLHVIAENKDEEDIESTTDKQVVVQQESDGVDCSSQLLSKKRVTTMMIETWVPD